MNTINKVSFSTTLIDKQIEVTERLDKINIKLKARDFQTRYSLINIKGVRKFKWWINIII